VSVGVDGMDAVNDDSELELSEFNANYSSIIFKSR
jgi:hypothetical protein